MSVVDDISETIPFKCYNYSVLFPRILNSVSAMVWFLISLTHLHCYSEYLSFKIIKEAQVVKPLPDRHVSYLISYCEQIRKIRNVRKQGSFGVTPNEVRYHLEYLFICGISPECRYLDINEYLFNCVVVVVVYRVKTR